MTVEQLTQITSAPKEAVPGRLSFQDAAKAVRDNSRLKALAFGKGDPNDWPQALAADCAAMTDLYTKLAEDLTRITGVKATHLPTFSPLMCQEAIGKAYPDAYFRACGIWASFDGQVCNWHRIVVHRIASESAVVNRRKSLGRKTVGRTSIELHPRIVYPLFPVDHFQDTAKFLALGAGVGGEKLYEVVLAGYSYADPDDHPMNMPASVHAKLAVLKTTHFDYHPKVLRGVQVAKKDVTVEEMRTYHHYDPDPALVVHFGLEFKPFVAEFWEEPLHLNNSTPANMPSLRSAAIQGGTLFVAAVLLCSSWLTTGLPWWGNTLLTFFGLSCTLACWATFAVYRDGVQEAFEAMRGVERHELLLYPPQDRGSSWPSTTQGGFRPPVFFSRVLLRPIFFRPWPRSGRTRRVLLVPSFSAHSNSSGVLVDPHPLGAPGLGAFRPGSQSGRWVRGNLRMSSAGRPYCGTLRYGCSASSPPRRSKSTLAPPGTRVNVTRTLL